MDMKLGDRVELLKTIDVVENTWTDEHILTFLKEPAEGLSRGWVVGRWMHPILERELIQVQLDGRQKPMWVNPYDLDVIG